MVSHNCVPQAKAARAHLGPPARHLAVPQDEQEPWQRRAESSKSTSAYRGRRSAQQWQAGASGCVLWCRRKVAGPRWLLGRHATSISRALNVKIPGPPQFRPCHDSKHLLSMASAPRISHILWLNMLVVPAAPFSPISILVSTLLVRPFAQPA